MKIWLHFVFFEGFWKMAIRFGWSAREERHTRVSLKWDKESFGKMGIHLLFKTLITRSIVCLCVSNELWKCEFPKMGLGQNERSGKQSFCKFQMFLGSSVLWVSNLRTSSFRFLVHIKLHTFLLIRTPVGVDNETLKGNFKNEYVNSI